MLYYDFRPESTLELSCVLAHCYCLLNKQFLLVWRELVFLRSKYFANDMNEGNDFPEGCAGANNKALPLAVIRNRRLNSVALLDPLLSVQSSSV